MHGDVIDFGTAWGVALVAAAMRMAVHDGLTWNRSIAFPLIPTVDFRQPFVKDVVPRELIVIHCPRQIMRART